MGVNTSSAGRFDAVPRRGGKSGRPGKHHNKHSGKTWKVLLSLFLICVSCYLVGSYSQIPFIKKARETIIITAHETMRHRWIMKVFPPSVYTDVVNRYEEALKRQDDWNTDKSRYQGNNAPYGDDTDWMHNLDPEQLDEEIKNLPEDQRYFYTRF